MIKESLQKGIILFLSIPNNPIKDAVRNTFYGNVISERIVEYALCFFKLGIKPSRKIKILDIGCYYSNFPIQLASMGFSVYGLDVNNYELTHPNFTFIKGDILQDNIGDETYNIITCISTIEHIGLGDYGDSKDKKGDIKAMESMKSSLKKNGVLLLTTPFGTKITTHTHRSYDLKSLNALFKGFQIKEKLFYMEKESKWIPATYAQVEKTDNEKKVKAMVFVKAIKK